MKIMTKPPQSDERLVATYLRGDHRAFLTLYKKYRGELYSYIFAIVRSRELADEAFQTTFMKFILKIKETQGAHIVKNLLITIARNEAIDLLRKQSVLSKRFVSMDVSEPIVFPNEDTRECSKEKLAQMNHLILNLPEEQREVLWLKIRTKMTFVEIGKLLNIPFKTAASRYEHAVKKTKGEFKR